MKNGDDGFAFQNWRPNQREWAFTYALSKPYETAYWIWLQLGINSPNWDKDKYQTKRTWLIPADVMLRAERLLSPIQNTLPYRARKGMRIEIQALSLDAITLLSEWELTWNGGGTWALPESHVFRQMYLEATPKTLPCFDTENWETTRNGRNTVSLDAELPERAAAG